MDISGKTVLITGAGMGIGALTCIELAKAGANIIGVDIQKKEMNETKKQVEALGRKFFPYACDLSRPDNIEALVRQIGYDKLTFHILINNAGIAPSGPYLSQNFSTWEKAISININAVAKLTYLCLPVLANHTKAHIVNLASVAGKFGSEGTVIYSATKHAVVGFSQALRMELYDSNIGVSWICPTMVKTRMIDGVKPSFFTPIIEPILVVKAILTSIRKNRGELIVPSRLRFSVVVLPALFPKFSLWLAVRMKASKGWLLANKGLEKNIPK
ncbi:SDR family NAD(P)-dependent oxidoreductase [Leptospira sp. 'Mane']|uniref:SDR family NAD(P)-dependent oxidoreductase n=1 Tax=Leptospira sp. 'Mane' TaxID=3387407 RepID=UPI00398B7761